MNTNETPAKAIIKPIDFTIFKRSPAMKKCEIKAINSGCVFNRREARPVSVSLVPQLKDKIWITKTVPNNKSRGQ